MLAMPEPGAERLAISTVESKFDNKPVRVRVTWDGVVRSLTTPRRAACTVASCGTGMHADLDKDGKSRGCRHKDGPGWIPATFSKGRKASEAELISILVVDIDHLPDDAALADTLAKLEPYAYVGHATHSDKPGDRCARVAVRLSRPVPGAEWSRFWATAMSTLGMPADPACCDAGRLYFKPSRPSDADFWFATHEGDPLDVDAILERAPTVAPTIAKRLSLDASGTVEKGARHALLKSTAGALRNRGAGESEILAGLTLANQRCNPPKPDAELSALATWAAGQPITTLEKTKGMDAVQLANRYVENHATHPDGITLRRWRGDCYRWLEQVGCYTKLTDEQIEAELYRKLSLCKRSEVGDVRHALIAVTDLLIDHVELGDSLDGEKLSPAHDRAVTPNGVLHLPTLTITPATPRYFATSSLGVSYDAKAPRPEKWLAFLDQLWPDDDESICALQDWFGYQLSPDTRQQKIAMIIGPKRSGKGTIARVLAALLGPANVCSPTLAQLGTNFGLMPLIGRTAAIIGDARLGGRSDIAQVIERLLSISGEDLQTVDRKHRALWTGKLSTRITIISNELPRFSDASDALASRMLMFELNQTWFGREDSELTSTLTSELPGILLWAIQGWKRLRKRGHFHQPESSRAAIDELADLASPVAAWVRECCEVKNDRDHAGYWLTPEAAFGSFILWCERSGVKSPPAMTTFGRDVKTVTQCRRVQVTRGVARPWVYVGLVLK